MRMAFKDGQLHTNEFHYPNGNLSPLPKAKHHYTPLGDYMVDGYVERKSALYHCKDKIGDEITLYTYDITQLKCGREPHNAFGKMVFRIESAPRQMSKSETLERAQKYGTEMNNTLGRAWIIDKLRRVA